MRPMRHAATTVLAVAIAVALAGGCDGGGSGSTPPLLGASPGGSATIYSFAAASASPQNDCA